MSAQKIYIKNLILVFTGLVLAGPIFSQQTPLSNFYNFNEYLLNPAEAGASGRLLGTASHRVQWQGIEGAPTTSFFGIHGSLNDKMGLGGRVILDQTDILKQFNASLSYSYRIIINEKAKLSFGLSAMAIQNSVGYSDAVVGNLADEVVTGGDQDGMTFDAEAGVMLTYDKFRFGIASSHLFESGVDYDLPDGNGSATFERIRQFKAYGSYAFEISDNWDVEPFVLMRNQGTESFQFEANALASWRQMLYLGAGYRQEAGMIARAGFQITDQITIAYAYEFSGSGVASYSSGSHEFMLGYKLGKKSNQQEQVNKDLMPQPVAEKAAVENEVKEEVQEKEEEKEEEKETSTESRVGPTVTNIVKNEVESEEPKETVVKEEPVNENETRYKDYTPEVEEAFEKKIKFEFNRIKANLDDNKSLDRIAIFLKKNPTVNIVIEGHTCNRGSEEVNTRYSLLRANSVRNYLISQGVNPKQMEAKAMLDKEPLVPNTTPENRQKNRRVEIELVE